MDKTDAKRANRKLILASGSPYRRMLLDRLDLNFAVQPANIDEVPRPGEAAIDYVTRLAREKAHTVSDTLASTAEPSVIIGSDQIAVHDAKILGKPGDAKVACRQLAGFSGSVVEFLTAVCILDTDNNQCEETVDVTRVHFRNLSDSEIKNYVEHERPFDCAGGFKAESLGIVLFNQIESTDPTGLLGLPLIWVAAVLSRFGIDALEARR